MHGSQVFQLHDLLNANLPAFVRSTHVDALSLAHSRNLLMVMRKVAEVSERSSLVLQMASFFKALAQTCLVLAHCLYDEADGDRVTTARAVLSDPMLPVKADAQASPQKHSSLLQSSALLLGGDMRRWLETRVACRRVFSVLVLCLSCPTWGLSCLPSACLHASCVPAACQCDHSPLRWNRF